MRKWLYIVSFISLSFVGGLSPHDYYVSILEHDEVTILDVRLWEEYASDRIINSLWAGERAELDRVVQDLDKDRAIYLYCDYNERSVVVSKILKKKGFTQIFKLEGGYVDWKNMGFPVDTIILADSLKQNAIYDEQ